MKRDKITILVGVFTLWAMTLCLSLEANVKHHQDFTDILSQYVESDGLVQYANLCQDSRLAEYTTKLSGTKWQTLNQKDQMAFWINTYNAFTLKIICDNYPVKSINELHKGGLVLGTVFKSTVWDKEFFAIDGKSMSLGYVEHEILRKGEDKDRIHFSIVCAAVSCPPLRQHAYEGYKINEQLEQQGNIFLAREDLNSFDYNRKRAYLSGIFKWFLEDFGRNKQELLSYLAQYAPTEKIKNSLMTETRQWKIKWKKYDWSLNDANSKL